MDVKSKTWITSDIHFYHHNILKYCAATRPYKDVMEMNDIIVNQWNSLISPIDRVYILGDVAFADAQRSAKVVQRCFGEKILITGNHDTKNLKDYNFRSCFSSVHEYLTVNYKGTFVVMFHYPIWEWDQMHQGSVHFHGHLHGRPNGVSGRIMDVGMDSNQCMPFLLDNAIATALKQPIRQHYKR